ncbi:MAG TPA: serine--tRNA ligase [Baekduia sp.]|nr:serine--tRNA ligase [Baekduia sp.]
MLDLRRIRSEPDEVRAALARRGGKDAELIDELLTLDAQWRDATAKAEQARAEQKAGSPKGKPDDAELARMRDAAAKVKELTAAAGAAEEQLQELLRRLPNTPDPTAADADTVIKTVGDATKTGKDHLELAGERIDMERGARLSGARFAYLRGDLARLELALVSWVMDKLAGHGFETVIPPVLVREEALYGTGFLPDTEQQIYKLADDDLYLVGTSEVALASLHAGEIVDGELPLRYAGFSSCFRREAGAAGKDTRGIFRVHQFDKVEMFAFVDPATSVDEHERILAIEEEILQELGLSYRVVNIAVDDLGASAAKKYDCEAWLPGQGKYRELTSCSNTTDFQARRLDIRYRPDGGKPETLHTLNGTAVAVGRTLVALLENGQQEDGSIAMPEVLHSYGARPVLPPA